MLTPLLWQTLKDLGHPKILWRLFLPFLVALVVVVIAASLLWSWLGAPEWAAFTQSAQAAVTDWPLIGGFLAWLIGVLLAVFAGLLGVFLGGYLVLLLALIITGLMTDSLVRAVRDIHYPEVAYTGHGSFWGMVLDLFKLGGLLVIILLLSLPLLFIPLVNFVWLAFLGFFFFRQALLMDVGQAVLSPAGYAQAKRWRQGAPTSVLLLFYSLTLVPLLSFFAPLLGVIFLAHWMLAHKNRLEQLEAN